jgi:pSer/pThr/pTyr-binding forkhead associated (FHA) protein
MPPKTKGPHVIVHKGTLTGRIYEITKKIITIGREVGNDIVVNDVAISRVHARLICVDEAKPAFVLEDMGSTNGTFVNGQPLQGSIEINFEDEILLAQDVYVIIKNGIFSPAPPKELPVSETQKLNNKVSDGNKNTRKVDTGPFEGTTLESLERLSDQLLEDDTNNHAQPDPRYFTKEPTSPDHNDVFISYSRVDLEIMNRITGTLQQKGMRVWVDKQKLAPGEPSWRRAIQNAIDRSGCVLVILSPDARKSKWVEAELDYAETQHKKIFCVLARGDRESTALLGYTLSQWVDIQPDYDNAMQHLLNVIHEYLKKP